MGEYALHRGESIKIGTCEDMYYLRAEQRAEIRGYGFDEDTLGVIRFRFPFPDEDTIDPGCFDDHDKGVEVPGYSLPAELSGDEHYSVQFVNESAGYVVSLPCPEQFGQPGMSVEMPNGVRVGRNGFRGYPVVKQQAFRGGHLVTLLACGACGGKHRLDTLEDAEPVIAAFRDEAERQEFRRDLDGWGYANSDKRRTFLLEMAVRIKSGYMVAVPA